MKELGTFQVVSSQVTVADPCYKKVDLMGKNDIAVLNGQWNAHIELEHVTKGRVATLYVAHTQSSAVEDWQLTKIDGGVDSGQMSVFDSYHFRNNSEAPASLRKAATEPDPDHDGSGLFYLACCEQTSKAEEGGVLLHGAVSSSGYGDGSYPIFTRKNKDGVVVGIKVEFMGSDDEVEDDLDEDEDEDGPMIEDDEEGEDN